VVFFLSLDIILTSAAIIIGGLMKKHALILMLAIVALVAASAAPSKGLDQYWTDKGASYGAAGAFSHPAAWEPGQYVTLGILNKGKPESVYTMLLVRKEDGGWVIENSAIDKKGKEQATQMLLKGFDEAIKSGDASNIDLVWIKMLDKDGKVSTIDGAPIKMMKGMMKSSWERMVVKSSSPADGGDQKVPAGGFSGTAYVKSSATAMGKTVETEVWMHPAVPINGVVKSKDVDGKSESVLLAFGKDGKPKIQ
jgi:hypothetical protein